MRMIHYFALLLALVVPALLGTAALGLLGHVDLHVKVGLVTAIATVGAHTLVILFMIVTGRVLREAVAQRDLPPRFLAELNEFFGRTSAYPAAVFGALAIVAAAVLGYGRQGFGLHPLVHMLAGIMALAFNSWVFTEELRALRANRVLVDRAAAELDRLDQELAARGESVAAQEPGIDAAAMAAGALIVAVSAWMPYLYWGLIEWRGDFSKVSLHPWIEVSGAGLLVWWLARREAAAGAGA